MGYLTPQSEALKHKGILPLVVVAEPGPPNAPTDGKAQTLLDFVRPKMLRQHRDHLVDGIPVKVQVTVVVPDRVETRQNVLRGQLARAVLAAQV